MAGLRLRSLILTAKSVRVHATSRYAVFLSVYGQKRPLLTKYAQLASLAGSLARFFGSTWVFPVRTRPQTRQTVPCDRADLTEFAAFSSGGGRVALSNFPASETS